MRITCYYCLRRKADHPHETCLGDRPQFVSLYERAG